MAGHNNLLSADPVTQHYHVARSTHYTKWQHGATGPVSKALLHNFRQKEPKFKFHEELLKPMKNLN